MSENLKGPRKEEKKEEVLYSVPPPAEYFNVMNISHTPEEFVFEIGQISGEPKVALMFKRLVTSTTHAKRILKALDENIKKYESKFGPIEGPRFPDKKDAPSGEGGQS